MSTPNTTFYLSNDTKLTDVYPLESNGPSSTGVSGGPNRSVPMEIVDIDYTTQTLTIIGDYQTRFAPGFEFDLVDIDHTTPSPYTGSYVADSSSYSGMATKITLAPTTPLATARFDVAKILDGTNGSVTIVGMYADPRTNDRTPYACADMFYPGSVFRVSDTGSTLYNHDYTVTQSTPSSHYQLTDVVVSAVNTTLTVAGDCRAFFGGGTTVKIFGSNTHPDLNNDTVDSTVVHTMLGAPSISGGSTIIVIDTVLPPATNVSGPSTGSIRPTEPTVVINIDYVYPFVGALNTIEASAPQPHSVAIYSTSITPLAPGQFNVAWRVVGDTSAIHKAGTEITIKNNNYYHFKRLLIDSVAYHSTGGVTEIRTIVTDTSGTTPQIAAAGDVVFPVPMLPYGHIRYTVPEAASPLQLVGRGVTHYNDNTTWGQALQNNSIHQLENFAHTIAPESPLEGQFWFNPSVPSMSIRYNDLWNGVMVSGMPATGNLDMNHHNINNLADPTGPLDAIALGYADTRYVNVVGDAMTGVLSMTSNKITNLADGIDPQDALNVRTGDQRYINVTGDAMMGDLSLGDHFITNLKDPALAQDAATKNYVDSLSSGIIWLSAVLDSNLFDDSLSSPPPAPDGDADLLFYRSYYIKPARYAILGLNTALNVWHIGGDRSASFIVGQTFTVKNCTADIGGVITSADGTYTVSAITVVAGDTHLTVTETAPIPSFANINGDLYHSTGSWNGLDGHIVAWTGTQWIDVLDRPVVTGDRFGIFFEIDNDETITWGVDGGNDYVTSPRPGGSFGPLAGDIIHTRAGQIAIAGAIGDDLAVTWDYQTPSEPDAVSVLGRNSPHYGHSYTFRGTWKNGQYGTTSNNASTGDTEIGYKWIEFAGPSMIIDGSGLKYSGNVLNVGAGTGVLVTNNAVGINIAWLNSNYMRRDGTTAFLADISMGDFRLTDLADPINPYDATTLQYLNTNYMSLSGGSVMIGNLDMGGFSVINVAAPVDPTDAANKMYVDTKLAMTGGTMTGPITMSGATATIDMGGNNIIDLADPTNPQDAVNLRTADSRFVNITGDVMAGPLTLAADPTQVLHAATKQYVDQEVSAAVAGVQAVDIDGGTY